MPAAADACSSSSNAPPSIAINSNLSTNTSATRAVANNTFNHW